ncbi:FtsX-like permease family protein [Rhodocytophaga rosea]|uniref:FtsX-like permease family protein n=1 Tax=Rhodocytophaga rosea TaxID=2704465 RepID=A0A6C0GGT3_9BACT|nr:ABC transporter permease [Rhodocytophaga rosea]QHT67034.1 FtsX-like permease family protein [Rhodocytophaga rosea]
MLRNYLTIAYRNLKKSKLFSAINILGLALGIAACLLILQYVCYELSFDRFHTDASRIYRITNDRYQKGKLIQHGTITYPTIGPTLVKEYPEVEANTRLTDGGKMLIRYQDNLIAENNSLIADDKFLTFFSFPLLAGNPKTALTTTHTVVITESLATKVFGFPVKEMDKAIGKSIYLDTDKNPFQVTGIAKDVPIHSHLQFNLLISYPTIIKDWGEWTDNSWTSSDFYHYIKLKPGISKASLEAKLPEFSDRFFQGDKVSGSVEKFFLQPLVDAHLYSDYEYEIGETTNGKIVWVMLAVAIIILLIAWINYINLTTTRSLERAKEVGVRKVLGAQKNQIIRQFLAESVVLNVLGFILALTLTQFAQPLLNTFTGKKLSLSLLIYNGYSGYLTGLFILLVFCAGVILSGFYPAFSLSAFQPIAVLKGKFTSTTKGGFLRKALVVSQYAASIALIIATITIYTQIQYMRNKDLGLNIEQMLVMRGPGLTEYDSTFIDRINTFKTELKRLPAIQKSATSSNLPGDRLPRTFDFRRKNDPEQATVTMSRMNIDSDFIDTYQMNVVSGRTFLLSDHNPDFNKIRHILLNQTAVKLLGFKTDSAAVHQTITFWNRDWEVVGIVKDFHQQSLKNLVEPIVFLPTYATGATISMKVRTENLPATIDYIQDKFMTFFPGNQFEYFFMDDQFNRQYQDDQKFGKVLGLFSILTIIVSSLGLFGLSYYTTLQRTKEIGIRKVLGASVGQLLFLLSKDFVLLLLLANMIALPLAWFGIHAWLQNYAYHIDITPWLLVLPSLMVLLMALFTVSFQTLRSAKENPVKALRYE